MLHDSVEEKFLCNEKIPARLAGIFCQRCRSGCEIRPVFNCSKTMWSEWMLNISSSCSSQSVWWCHVV